MSRYDDPLPQAKMDKDEYHRFTQLFREAEEAKLRLRNFREEAVRLCPIKVGDKVAVTGYSHNGKAMEVTRIWLADGPKNAHWKCRGKVLLKDGSVGLQEAEHHVEITNAT